jgi:hypothetical protein
LPDTTSDIGYYRYQGFALEQKIAWVRDGTGSRALAEAQAALAGLGLDLIESERTLRDLVTKLGGGWEGSAGLAAGHAADLAGARVTLQTTSVDRTRYGMPGAPPAPEYGLWDAFTVRPSDLFDVQTDFDDRVARRRAADAEANRVLHEHEAASRANLAGLPPLGEVPRITVKVTPPDARRGEGDGDTEHSHRYFLGSDDLDPTVDLVVLRHSVIGDDRGHP